MFTDSELLEYDCEIAVKAWVYELPEYFQKIAIKAINDLREENFSWEWIETALKKKSVGQWVKQGSMGLLWNNRYQAYVWKQLERNHESQKINTDEFLDCKTEIQEYLDSINRLGD